MKLRTVPHQKLNPHKLCKYIALLLLIVFQYSTIRAEADETNTAVGGFNCESECHDIGEDAASETDIDTVNSSWFEDCVKVFGTLNINENTTLDDTRMLMMPGSEIVVESGNTLILTSSYLTGCDTLWRGIRVESGATLRTFLDTITGANAAIFLEDSVTVIVRFSRFENNYIGIATAMPYDVSAEQKQIGNGFIFGNTFVNSGTLLIPYSGHHYAPSWPSSSNIPYNRDFAAVYLRNTGGLNVGINLAQARKNVIDGLRNGIVLDTSTASVVYCDIDDLLGTITQSEDVEDLTSTGIWARGSNVQILKNDLDAMQDGIVSISSTADILDNDVRLKIISLPGNNTNTRGIAVTSTKEPVKIERNTVEEGDVGVYVTGGSTDFTIKNDTITSETDTANRIGIHIDGWELAGADTALIEDNVITFTDVYFGIGIWIINSLGVNVISNDITFVRENEKNAKFTAGIRTLCALNMKINKNTIIGEDDYATPRHYGIFYEESPDNTVFCNYIYYMSRGFTGSAMSDGSNLISNVFDTTNPIGLELYGSTTLGPQKHYGNRWIAEHDEYGAYISGGDSLATAQASPFIIDNDGVCDLWPCPIGPAAVATTWFTDLTGTAKTCEGLPPSPLTDEDYEDILMNPWDFDDYEDQMTWMTKAWIFEAILLDEDLLKNTRLDSFYDADDTEPLGVLVSADFAIHEPYDSVSALKLVSDEIMDSLDIIVWIDEELYNLSRDSNALRERRETAVNEIVLLQEDRLELLEEAAGDEAAALSSAESSLGSLTTTSDFEEYYKRALLYEIEWKTDGPSSLSSSDWEEIQEIATLCTWEGGKAAALAQSLCAIARDSIVGPAETCTGVEPRSPHSSVTLEHGDLIIYPNPSQLGWYVVLPSEARELRLLDLTGRVLFVKRTDVDKIFLPASDLPAGMYVVQVGDGEGKVLASRKIVLQR